MNSNNSVSLEETSNNIKQLPAAIQNLILGQVFQDERLAADVAPNTSVEASEPEPVSMPGKLDVAVLFHHLRQCGYCVCTDLILQDEASCILEEVRDLKRRPGKMSLHWEENSLRGDQYVWLDPSNAEVADRLPRSFQFMNEMQAWLHQFNQYAALALDSCKFMSAEYPGGGARYVRHTDRSAMIPHRRLTALLYLNPSWVPEDGGQLQIYAYHEQVVRVSPHLGHIAFFWADVEHEVLPAYNHRFALTCWYSGQKELDESITHAAEPPQPTTSTSSTSA